MNISVLGCGWLGEPLAKALIAQKHLVKGSTTSREKLNRLKFEGLPAYEIKILPEGVQGDISAFLSQTYLLIVNIPPGLRKDPDSDFVGKISLLKEYIEKSPVEQVIFVSSTGVYEDSKDFSVYTEEVDPNGSSENSLQLIAAEKELKAAASFTTSIIRFGGLIGPGRHPVNYMAGRKGIKDPEAPVNLIHQQDCINLIREIINQESWGNTFNAVYPEHPSKEEYYSRKAEELGLEKPEFDHSEASRGKEIRSVNLTAMLDFKFKRPV